MTHLRKIFSHIGHISTYEGYDVVFGGVYGGWTDQNDHHIHLPIAFLLEDERIVITLLFYKYNPRSITSVPKGAGEEGEKHITRTE